MIPCELTLRNFMCYRGDVPTLRFDGIHIACLSGANGAGKSALLDAITWALWGKARLKSDDDLIAQGESDMLVGLVFDLNQQRYRVVRRRQRPRRAHGNGTSTLDLHIASGETWQTIGAATIKETQQIIDSLLRMTYDTFINASFLLQGRADEFTSKTPAKRKEVFVDMLDLRDYQELEAQARERARLLKAQVQTLDATITILAQEADKLTIYTTLAAEAATRATAQAQQVDAAEQAQQTADAQVRALEAQQQRRNDIAARQQELDTSLRQHEQELADLRAAIAAAETLLARRSEIDAGMAAWQAAQQRVAHLDALRPQHDTLSEGLRQQHDLLKEARRALQSELEQQQHRAQHLATQQRKRDEHATELDNLTPQLEAYATLDKEQDALRQQRADLDQHIEQAATLQQERSTQQQALDTLRAQHETTRSEQQQRIAWLEKQLAERDTWQQQHTHACQQRDAAQQLAAQLADLRAREQQATEQAGEQRARCDHLKQQADDLKRRKALVEDDPDSSTCPICGSHLGEQGTATILHTYEQELATLREHYREANSTARQHEKDLAALRNEAAALEQQQATAQQAAARIDTLAGNLARAAQWEQERAQAQQTLDAAQQALDTRSYGAAERAELARIEGELARIGANPTQRDPARPLRQQRTALEQQQQALEQQRSARDNLRNRQAVLQQQIAALEEETAALPDVQRQAELLRAQLEQEDFAPDARAEARRIEQELAALGYHSEEHTAARSEAQHLSRWQEEAQRLAIAEQTLERDRHAETRTADQHDRLRNEQEQLRAEDATLAQEVRALPAAQQHAHTCAEQVKEQRRALEAERRDQAEKETLRDKASSAAQQRRAAQAERTTVAERQSIFEELAEACGKKGVQAMLIESAIPQVEDEANLLLARMTNNQMHITFDTQRTTKTTGEIQETLDINIADALGTRAYDSFSGGEAMRINFAIRVALSRLLAHRAGTRLQTLVIDEGFGALDTEGRERFVEAISSIEHDFKLILVITHMEELKDRFPAHIHITKQPDGSTWELV